MSAPLSSLWLDVRYALRAMVKAPGFTAVVALTLALGIGASTTMFSVVHSIVLKPLPYAEPEQLAAVYVKYASVKNLDRLAISGAEYDDLRRACRSCAGTAAWTYRSFAISSGERPARIDAVLAEPALAPLLGVRPQLGRWFDAGDGANAIVLGDAVWRRVFAADPGLVGRAIVVDGAPVTVVGVMPPGFEYPRGAEAWRPRPIDADPGAHQYGALVRLAPGATVASFNAELRALAAQWAEGAGAEQHHIGPVDHPIFAVSLHADVIGDVATTLWLLTGGALLVLLIAIVNIAGLLLARSETRTREVAVRHALGATRRRLARQFLTESMLLAALGGGLAVVVALWALDGVVALIPSTAPRIAAIELDGAAVAFAIACAAAAALLFGLAPIVHARRNDLHGALKDGAPQATRSRARLRVRRALVVTQLALAVVLVVACAVMVRSFDRLQRADLGFAPDHLLTFRIEPPANAPAAAFWERLEARLRALPGAEAATLLDAMPTQRGRFNQPFEIVGRAPDEDHVARGLQVAGLQMPETLGARLVRGRAFLPSDAAGAPGVALINEAFAAAFFPGVDPIGQRLKLLRRDGEFTIVGILADAVQVGVAEPIVPDVILPLAQAQKPPPSMTGVIRTRGAPRALLPAVHRLVAELDPALPISDVTTMDDALWEDVARPRFLAFLLTSFAGLALLLAAIGIYGVMAHTVAQRTHEIGLRVALGALPGQVRLMVLRQAGRLVAAGIAAGIAAAIALQLALGAKLTGLFYGDGLTQPLLLAGVAAAVALAALLATWIPARRATRIEPMIALRSE